MFHPFATSRKKIMRPWGTELREARVRARKSIDDTARALKIQPGYIQALETMQVRELPGAVYARYFFIRYARWLDLDPEKLLPFFEKTLVQHFHSVRVHLIPRVSSGDLRVWTRIARWSIAAGGALACIVYFGFHVYAMMLPPELAVMSPAEDMHVLHASFVVVGMTHPEAHVTVNGERIQTDPQGYFETAVTLQDGVNEISVSAKSKYSRPQEIVRHVIVDESPSVSGQRNDRIAASERKK